jgi:hypothetical protein
VALGRWLRRTRFPGDPNVTEGPPIVLAGSGKRKRPGGKKPYER